ncbi:unnamed protein product, partial [Mesocestoides corti]|uniref:MFS domain-containing protein n=1 Tax=Mesocestoides corti TaxID=53468 RepID=A0A0R3UC09_MESCO
MTLCRQRTAQQQPAELLSSQRLFDGPPTTARTAAYYICFALQGVCSGTAMTQMIIVLSDWVGPERLAKSLAIMMVNLGLLYVPAQALIAGTESVASAFGRPNEEGGFANRRGREDGTGGALFEPPKHHLRGQELRG